MSAEAQSNPGQSPRRRLDGWKEIAEHIGKIHWRTAQRWEKDGLPVHRIGRTKKVFAHTDELDRWSASRTSGPSIDPPPDPAIPIRKPRPILLWKILALAASFAAVVFLFELLPGRPGQLAPNPRIGRLLPRSTSEGWRPKQISLIHWPTYMAISPRGDKLFAKSSYGRTLSIVSTTSNSVRTLALPRDGGPLAISPKGKLYIGSSVDGIMTIDAESGQLLPGLIATGGPVISMAITPDGEKLFLAMGTSGLKRLSTGSGKLAVVSDRVCPENLEMDQQGKRLYVAYQCTGPKAQDGHDSVEILDAESEVSLGIVTGPPMVSGRPFASPDGKLVLLDGLDACSAPQYDHAGCKSAPSRVFHLLRPSDRQILHTFEFPVGFSPAHFLDNSRFLLLGDSVSVVDAARYSVLERWNGTADCDAKDIVFTPDRRHAYLGCGQSNSIFVLQPESAECSPPQPGLAMFYSADGATEDAVGVTKLTPYGKPRFTPGRVGQAFFLDGGSYLATSWTGHYQFGLHDSTLALYAKFADVGSEMVLLDWTAENPQRGIRLLKSTAERFVFQSWPGSSQLESTTSVKPNTWYHLVVTRTAQDLTLYVNGKLESRGAPSSPPDRLLRWPLFLGAKSETPSFYGWLDEIGFYNRALTATEVKELYERRERGPCKL